VRPVLAFLFALLSFGFAAQVFAAAGEDIPRIRIEELKQLMDAGANMVIIDTQPKDRYNEGHIKGALSLPRKASLSAEDVERLSPKMTLVLYCDCGPGESDSASVGEQLSEMGFSEVKVLKDPSIEGWKKAGYPIEK
jgi:rhodanese-related sulfurtransferase